MTFYISEYAYLVFSLNFTLDMFFMLIIYFVRQVLIFFCARCTSLCNTYVQKYVYVKHDLENLQFHKISFECMCDEQRSFDDQFKVNTYKCSENVRSILAMERFLLHKLCEISTNKHSYTSVHVQLVKMGRFLGAIGEKCDYSISTRKKGTCDTARDTKCINTQTDGYKRIHRYR